MASVCDRENKFLLGQTNVNTLSETFPTATPASTTLGWYSWWGLSIRFSGCNQRLLQLRPMLDGELKQFVRPAELEFRANVLAVRFHGRCAEKQFGSDFFI